MINKHLKWRPVAIALTATMLSFAIVAFNPTSVYAKGGSSAPKDYKDSSDDITCHANDSSSITCSTSSGWPSTGDHNTLTFYFDPSQSTNGYDIWVAKPGHGELQINANLACKQDGAYSASIEDGKSTCYIINPGGSPLDGAPVGLFNDNSKLSQTADPPDTCSIKMFGGSNPSHPTSCKWGGDGSARTVPADFKSGYDSWKGQEDATKACENAIGMLSFILCPFMGMANNAIMAMIGTSNMPAGTSYNSSFPSEGSKPQEPKGILISMLEMRPLLDKSDDSSAPALTAANEFCQPGDSGYACGIRTVWSNLKNITLGLYVVIFLVIIFANTASLGIDNYTIKKMLPRLIVSAVLIQFSLLIVSLAVDVFNIIGGTIPQLILSLASSNTGNFCGVTSQNKAGAMGPALGMAIAVMMQPGIGQIIAGIGGLILLILIVMVAIAAITAFFALIVRKLILFGLVIAAPLAFAAYILPGTEKYFKLWRDNLLKSLAMYPIATGLLAGSLLFSSLIIGMKACHDTAVSGMSIDVLIAILAPMMALLMLPKTFKWGGHLTSAIAGGIMGAGMRRSKAFGNAAKNTGKNAVKRGASAAKNAGQDRLAQSNFGKNTRTGRMLAGGGIGGFLGTAGGRQKVAARGGAAQTEADKTAGNMIRQMEENNRLLNDPHANLSPGKAQQLHNENARIHNQLFGAGASPAMQAAGVKAIANDHNALIRAQASMGQASFEKAMVASGVADTAIGTLQRHAMSFADGSTERTAIQNMYTGANVSSEVRAAGIKAMTAAKDGNGLIRAHQAVTATDGGHQAWQDAVSRSGVSGADMAEAISRSTASIVSPIDSSKPASIMPGNAHYSEEKARAYSMLTGAGASPEVRSSALGKFAESGNHDGVEAVRQGMIAAHTSADGTYDAVGAKAEWDRAANANFKAFDGVGGHLRQFDNLTRAAEIDKLDNPGFIKLPAREMKNLTSPEMIETLPSRSIVDSTPQNRHEIPADVRTNAAQWAHGGANMVDDDGQPVITAARRAAELRHAGDEAGAQAIEQKAADYRTVLDTSGNWIDSGGTTSSTSSSTAPSASSTGGVSSTTLPRGATGGYSFTTSPSGLFVPSSHSESGSTSTSTNDVDDDPQTPPGVGTPYGNPSTTGGSGTPGPTPDDPPIMHFDPEGSDLDPTYDVNRAVQTSILQDRAKGTVDANLVGEAISSAPTENTSVASSAIDDVITGTTAGAVAGTVASGSEAGWGIGAELARYEMERRAKDAASKAREANEAQGARIDSLKKSQDRQARGQTHKDARGNEISGPAPDKETPNE